MTALYDLSEYGGLRCYEVVQEYLGILLHDPEKFERFMESDHSEYRD